MPWVEMNRRGDCRVDVRLQTHKASHCLKMGLKKPAFLLLTLIWAISLSTGSAAEVVEVRIGSVDATPGSSVTVPVALSSNDFAVVSLDFTFEFDTTKLALNAVAAGPAATQAAKQVFVSTPAAGKANVFVLATTNQNTIPDGVIAYLSFVMDPSVVAGQGLDLTGVDVTVNDAQADTLPSTIVSGEVAAADCTGAPASVQDLTATKGTHADRVLLTWSPVSEATRYTVFRALNRTAANAQPLAVVTEDFYDDFNVQTQSVADAAGCARSTGIDSSPQTYYYWVVASNACGESTPAGPVSGYAGAGKALSSASVWPGVAPACAIVAILLLAGRKRQPV